MNTDRTALIAQAKDKHYRGAMQHLRSWSDLNRLLMQIADDLEEAERQIFVLQTLRESAAT